MQNNNKLRMQLHRFLFSVMLLFAAITSVGLLSSCSENEKDTDEFANWKSKNQSIGPIFTT